MKHLKHNLQHINSKFIFERDTPSAERIKAATTAIKAHEGATELEEDDVQRLAETCVAKLPVTADISGLLTQALADDPDKLISSAEIDALCDELVTLVDGGAAATSQLPEAPEGHRYVTTEDITPFLTDIPELYHEQVTQKLLTTTVPIESTGDAFEELMRRNVFEATGELTLQEEDAPDGHRWLTLSEISDWLETIEAADHDKAFQMVSKDPLNNDLEGEALATEIARRQTAAETQIAIDGLRTQPGYDQTPKADFNEARDAVTTAITNGELTIPEDIADDPEAVNEWLAQQVDIKLEDHDADPAARVEEVLAGRGTPVSPEVQQQMTERVAAARESGETPDNLITMLINLLKELGIDLGDEQDMYFDDNGNYVPYDGPGGRAENNGIPYSGEVHQGSFGLNESFYGVQSLTNQLREQDPQRLAQAEEIMAKFPAPNLEAWHGAILRNALNNDSFSANQPILLHNISTSTAALWIPGQAQATLHPATHGYGGVGNGSGSGSTPVGSFELYQMADGGKFTSRMGVRGLENKQNNYQATDVQDAYGVDPAAIGNSNSDARLIRIHQIRGRRTAGCTGLPEDIAARLDEAVTIYSGAAMERFVSNPTG